MCRLHREKEVDVSKEKYTYDLHSDSINAHYEIRSKIELLKFHVSIWQPAPMPADYQPGRRTK